MIGVINPAKFRWWPRFQAIDPGLGPAGHANCQLRRKGCVDTWGQSHDADPGCCDSAALLLGQHRVVEAVVDDDRALGGSN